ncbi:hypothetical protein BaRGS_00030345 [Batillaria attramentaria]|uniref:DNA polymerase kappa n=1 Tax=Batillaria attramentaria TaxID=370345 RepID=A0ABD0JUR5_9CAEN
MDYERSTDEDTESEEDWQETWDSGCTSGNVEQTQSSASVDAVNIGPSSSSTADKEASGPGGGSVPLMTRMQLNDHKAGMQGLDKEHINQIIYEASKGSRFFENERHALVAQLEASRDLSQSIVHVDMDAFYAAVEIRDDPSLRDKPMAVGGIGMLSTSNYEARKYGVRAAMPGFIGRKLCPQLILVPLNFPKYHEVSAQVREVFSDYDANFCPMSLDEAYLDFTSHLAQRRSMTTQQRSYLKRCQSVVEASLCRCDLNTTLRDAVVLGKKLPLEGDNASRLLAPSTAKEDGGSGTLEENGLASPRLLFKNSSKEGKKVESSQDIMAFDNCTLSRKTAPESCVFKTSSDCGGKEDVIDFKPLGIGSACHVCGKPVPAYEVVTFGLDVESAVQEMRCRIEQRTRLTASAGIAPNMMLAKVCSDKNKPNGQFYLPADLGKIMEFVRSLPIRKISGIGRVTEQLLGALGIVTCSDLYQQRALLYHLYSSVSFNYFMRVTCGIGSVQVARDEERKSMSTEQTFGELCRPEELYSKCLDLCHSLASDLAEEQLMGKTISLKLKTTDFQVRTRAQTISNFTNDAETIFSVAKGILRAEIQAELPKPLRLRLMGVRMSKLAPVTDCPREKQDTIRGFLSKTHSSAHTSGSPINTQVGAADPKCSAVSVSSAVPVAVDIQSGSKISSAQHDFTEVNIKDENSLHHQASGWNVVSSCDAKNAEDGSDRKSCDSDIDVKHDQKTAQRTEEASTEQVTAVSVNVKNSFLKDTAEGSKAENTVTSASNSKIDVNQNLTEDVSASRKTGISGLQQKKTGLSDNTAKDVDISSIHQKELSPEWTSAACRRDSAAEMVTATEKGKAGAVQDLHSTTTPSQYNTDTTSSRQHITPNNAAVEVSRNSTADTSIDSDTASLFVREPTFTCPVCCKAVGCVNLTDFNAHIDLCLQGGSKQSQQKQTADKSGKQQSSGGVSRKSKKTDMKSPSLGKKTSQVGADKSHSFGVSDQPQQERAAKTKFCSGTQQEAEKLELGGSSQSTASKQRQDITSDIPSSSQQLSSAKDVLEPVDYLVCPLCGAERADWTLESFNHHVDACLNRDAISQILREQRGKEEQCKKRHAGSSPEEQRGSQPGGKRTKKSSSPKPSRSILSFFKN